MNKPDPRQNDLLAEVFAGDWTDGRPAAFAQRAAAHARRRRAARRALSAGTAVIAILILAFALLRPFQPVATSTSSAPATAATPEYEIISDQELIAALRDRPLLVLPQPDGSRRIVTLD